LKAGSEPQNQTKTTTKNNLKKQKIKPTKERKEKTEPQHQNEKRK